ncbi:hypothetical protein MYAM1_001864 [Malassezia yamatoensis]|uniref:SWR1-complex protein 5 n=1 Tax=Malassezia yamatoensis TaxID=253288 RepID=A0AAJ5YTP9_9BASI|nr:hypothetical protein MYAM1_001864 [Malassezia yamatoensis]
MTDVIQLDDAAGKEDHSEGQQPGTLTAPDHHADTSKEKNTSFSNTVDAAKTTPPRDPNTDEQKSADSTTNNRSPTSQDTDVPKKSAETQVKKRVSNLGSLAAGTRKKRKSQLADLSAAATNQPVKLNTLEKSKLDWEQYKGSHVASSDSHTMSEAEREELDAQTQGGGSGLGNVKGYLHRKEFLDRVKDRLDASEYEAHNA